MQPEAGNSNVFGKVIAGFILILLLTIHTYGQTTPISTKAVGKKEAKIVKSKVPRKVTEAFYAEYPPNKISYDSWYGYPDRSYQNDWWDWYDNNFYSRTQDPEFYNVEYTKNNTPYKTVYTKNGEKVATHKTLSDLPKSVSVAISNGKYKAWKLGQDKEEIFKDKDTDQMKVYKVNVLKGTHRHTLFFQSDGKLLKDKRMS